VQLIIESPFLHFQISTDGIRVKQVLSNLLVNALKFTEQGAIKFGIEKQPNALLFYVADTGIGIDSKHYNKIFDHFHKIEQPDHKLYSGTGIGLSICKNLVELLGGKIWVESTLGKGSTFYFTIPLD
jgi:signal transduction histidine kinase